MGRDDFRLISSTTPTSRGRRTTVVGFSLFLFACGMLATVLGADGARGRDDPRDTARRVLQETLALGEVHSKTRSELAALRLRVTRLPLDAQARAAYASALLGVARTGSVIDAAVFHARLAARMAPVTVPVVRAAILVLAQAGRSSEAAQLTREMFDYDPSAAARLLGILEPHLPPDATERVLPDAPRAWLARIRELRRAGRGPEADTLITSGALRWPEDLQLRTLAAERATAARDWNSLAGLLPPDLVLPDDADSALLLVYRARSRSVLGDASGASMDLDRAVALGARLPWVLLLAGDVWLTLDNLERAKEMWGRALHAWPEEVPLQRADTLRRLARISEREGQAGTALREWREVLRLVPGDREAGLRVHELGGGDP